MWDDGPTRTLHEVLSGTGFSKILFAVSKDNGQTFGVPENFTHKLAGLAHVRQVIASN